MKNLIMIIAAAACVAALTGCNTFHGLGKDIEKGGEALQKISK